MRRNTARLHQGHLPPQHPTTSQDIPQDIHQWMISSGHWTMQCLKSMQTWKIINPLFMNITQPSWFALNLRLLLVQFSFSGYGSHMYTGKLRIQFSLATRFMYQTVGLSPPWVRPVLQPPFQRICVSSLFLDTLPDTRGRWTPEMFHSTFNQSRKTLPWVCNRCR